MQFDEVLRTWQEFFERECVRWAVIGGLGFSAAGYLVRDVHVRFIVDEPPAHVPDTGSDFDVTVVIAAVPQTTRRVIAGIEVNTPTIETLAAWEVALNDTTWLPGVLRCVTPFDDGAFQTALAATENYEVRVCSSAAVESEAWRDAVALLNRGRDIPDGAEPFTL